jgi:REP element-mobilizing transposase RayT
MGHGPDKRRRSIRLAGYDYAQAGAYFVTICAHERVCLFGEVSGGEMRLNEIGQIAAEEWVRSAEIRREIELDEWVVMPNHLHGIVVIVADPPTHGDSSSVGAHGHALAVGATGRSPLRQDRPHGPPKRSLGSFIAGFKSAVTTRINTLQGTPGAPVWQRNYYEHVIRDEDDLARIREYIANNPLQWDIDKNNPTHMRTEALRD